MSEIYDTKINPQVQLIIDEIFNMNGLTNEKISKLFSLNKNDLIHIICSQNEVIKSINKIYMKLNAISEIINTDE